MERVGVVRLRGFREDQSGVNLTPGEITSENFGTVSAMDAYLGGKAVSG